MKNVTTTIENALNSMLHLQTSKDIAPIPLQHHISDMLESFPEEEALQAIGRCVALFGEQAQEDLYVHMEQLQKSFLLYTQNLMRAHNIVINKKLLISLDADNALIFECEEHEEALLTLLGEDKELRKHLHILREYALTMRGLEYLCQAQGARPMENFRQFNVCLKGALSHFYLK